MEHFCHSPEKSLLLTMITVGIIFSIDSDNIFNNDGNQLFTRVAYAHNFTPNESAYFLAFAEQLKVESELVQTNLANNNISLVEEHAEKAATLLTPNITREIAEENRRIADELTSAVTRLQNISTLQETQGGQQEVNLDAILNEAITARIEQEQRENSTIRALALANLVDSILRNYGNAFDVGFDLTNMSNMAGMIVMSDSRMNMSMSIDMNSPSVGQTNMSSSPMMMRNDTDSNYSLVSTSDYQSAQALAVRAQEIFENELKALVPSIATGSIVQLEEGLMKLNQAIKNKALPMEIMMIAHTQIHPNLLQAFNLELR